MLEFAATADTEIHHLCADRLDQRCAFIVCDEINIPEPREFTVTDRRNKLHGRVCWGTEGL